MSSMSYQKYFKKNTNKVFMMGGCPKDQLMNFLDDFYRIRDGGHFKSSLRRDDLK